MPPTMANGKICYIEMPATDIVRSSDFYKRVFEWNIRKRGDGSTGFDDTTGEVSGAWVLGRPASAKPGLSITSSLTAWPRPWTPSSPTEAKSSNPSVRTLPRLLRGSAIQGET
jgi:hypothetical protein